MTDADDRRQLRAYAEGRDQEAIAAVIRRHGGMVAGVCRRVCGERDSDDAAQAVFLVLAEKARTVASHPAPAAWLHRTATQIALRTRRGEAARRRREQEVAAMAPTHTDDAPSPLPELDTALATLPERYRAALVAHYLEGREVPTLASDLGVSADAVAMRLSRGRDLLRSALARRGVPIAGAALLLALADAGRAGETAGAAGLALTNAAAVALSRAHLQGLLHVHLALWSASACAVALVAATTVAVTMTIGAKPPVAPVAPPIVATPPQPPPATTAATTSEPAMAIQIIDKPFVRTLYGRVGVHEPGKPYGPEIIGLLDQVWGAVGAAKVKTTGINHVLYDPGEGLFAGVEVVGDAGGLALDRREVRLARYAYYKYIGPYSGIPPATQRVFAEITRLGLQREMPGLEIYGHDNPDQSKLETELLYPVR
jgi:RNA polymerase sigma factor (sigma-70 family)